MSVKWPGDILDLHFSQRKISPTFKPLGVHIFLTMVLVVSGVIDSERSLLFFPNWPDLTWTSCSITRSELLSGNVSQKHEIAPARDFGSSFLASLKYEFHDATDHCLMAFLCTKMKVIILFSL